MPKPTGGWAAVPPVTKGIIVLNVAVFLLTALQRRQSER